MQLSFLLSILLLTKCIYTLIKHYLNIQTISGIKYFCLRGVSRKASNSEVIEEGARKYNVTRMPGWNAWLSIDDEYYFVLALNREVEGPESENTPDWSLWKHIETGINNKQNACKSSLTTPQN